jgi:hypothetical protein
MHAVQQTRGVTMAMRRHYAFKRAGDLAWYLNEGVGDMPLPHKDPRGP